MLFLLETFALCLVFASLWAVGGSEDFFGGQKWIRRFLAPAVFSLWAFLRSGFNWHYLIQMPFMMGASTLPYGADSLTMKWFLRGLFGIVNGSAASVVNIWRKRLDLSIFSIILSITCNIYFGVYNPFSNAMTEQFLIGLIIILIPAFTIKINDA